MTSNTCTKRVYTVEKYEKLGLRKAPEYESWHNMKQRCLNPRFVGYVRYGGAGIEICNRWVKSFSAFYEDMGERPSPNHSLDRIDGNKGYSPNNCRWADKTQQVANRGLNKNNLLRLKGVSRNRSKYTAKIWVDYKCIRLGTYEDRLDAAYMYDQFTVQIHGESVPTNFLGEHPIYKTIKEYRSE